MAAAGEPAIHSRDVFDDHDEWTPRVAQFRFDVPTGIGLAGRQPAQGVDQVQLKRFMDAERTVQKEFTRGPWVIQESTIEATYTGFLEGVAGIIPPTEKRLVFKCVQIGRCESGLVADVRLYYDRIELLAQLKMMPPGKGRQASR
jgi:hypothetical protein